MSPVRRPEPTEAPEYYFSYIGLVESGDVRDAMSRQLAVAVALLGAVPPDKQRYRYAPEKWDVSEVICHLTDTERVFTARAHWFARGFEAPLPGFDQDAAVRSARVEDRDFAGLLAEFEAVRRASISLYAGLPQEAWARRGMANERVFSVRALAHVTVGHVAHHLKILGERYLGG